MSEATQEQTFASSEKSTVLLVDGIHECKHLLGYRRANHLHPSKCGCREVSISNRSVSGINHHKGRGAVRLFAMNECHAKTVVSSRVITPASNDKVVICPWLA